MICPFNLKPCDCRVDELCAIAAGQAECPRIQDRAPMNEKPDRRAANNDGDGKGKVSNPKDAIADTRIPLWLLSPIAKIAWALAQFAGLLKYGAWNWRVAGVRASVYISAIERHIDAYKSGEKYDPVDGTDHRGNIMACCALLIEAEAAGKLEDDRPPIISHRAAVAEGEALMGKLKAQYADRKPRHWTIADDVK